MLSIRISATLSLFCLNWFTFRTLSHFGEILRVWECLLPARRIDCAQHKTWNQKILPWLTLVVSDQSAERGEKKNRSHQADVWESKINTNPKSYGPASHVFLNCFFKIFFFLMWTIFKVFVEFITILLLFHVLVLWLWGMWDLSSSAREGTHTPCTENEGLTTGALGSPKSCLLEFKVDLDC